VHHWSISVCITSMVFLRTASSRVLIESPAGLTSSQ